MRHLTIKKLKKQLAFLYSLCYNLTLVATDVLVAIYL